MIEVMILLTERPQFKLHTAYARMCTWGGGGADGLFVLILV